MQTAIRKLLRFSDTPECAHYLGLASQSFYEEFATEHGCEDLQDIQEKIGDGPMGQVHPCMLEFFFSNEYPDAEDRNKVWNIVDLFIKKRAAMLSPVEREYLRAIRNSYMSIYEVIEVVPNQYLKLRDLIQTDKPPIIAYEKSLTTQVSKWQVLGLRLAQEKGKTVLAGGGLPLERQVAEETAQIIKAINEMGLKSLNAATDDNNARLLKVMWAKEIANSYMNSAYKHKNRKIILKNSDGDDLEFHDLTFKLNADWNKIAKILAGYEDFNQEEDTKKRKFWNWFTFDEAKIKKDKSDTNDDVKYIETQLLVPNLSVPARNLGTIELLPNKMIVQANSAKRAEKLEKILVKFLGDNISKISVEKTKPNTQRADEAEGNADDLPEFNNEDILEEMQNMLDEHYKRCLNDKIPLLGDKTPKQACKTPEGRKKVITWLKDLEIHQFNNMPSVKYDTSWMWEELGLKTEVA